MAEDFLTHLRMVEDGQEQYLMSLIDERVADVTRAKTVADDLIEDGFDRMAVVEGKVETLKTTHGETLAGDRDAAELSMGDVSAALSGDDLDERTRAEIDRHYPELAKEIRDVERRLQQCLDLVEELGAELRLYRELQAEYERGGVDAGDARDRVLAFFTDQSRYGPDAATAVDVILQRVE